MKDVWTWVANAAAVTAILGFVIVIFQQIAQTRAAQQSIRAFLHLELKKVKFRNGKEMIVLAIYNSGETTASNVTVQSQSEIEWTSLSGNKKPDFTQTDSTLRILPGEQLEFLLGPASKLEVYTNSGVEVKLTYQGLPKSQKEFTDSQYLTLEHPSFLLKRTIR